MSGVAREMEWRRRRGVVQEDREEEGMEELVMGYDKMDKSEWDGGRS